MLLLNAQLTLFLCFLYNIQIPIKII